LTIDEEEEGGGAYAKPWNHRCQLRWRRNQQYWPVQVEVLAWAVTQWHQVLCNSVAIKVYSMRLHMSLSTNNLVPYISGRRSPCQALESQVPVEMEEEPAILACSS